MIVNGTPLEAYVLGGRSILVKREDLCSPAPGPMFSKMRGVVAHVTNRPESTIGVLDTLHSKAGIAVAYACQQLGKKCVNFWPRYKADPREGLPRWQQQHSSALGATTVELQAGRSAILYHRARKHLLENYGAGSYLMPNALKLPESITENAAEAVRTVAFDNFPSRGALVISVSSGTVASGVLRGLDEAVPEFHKFFRVFLHMGYSRSQEAVSRYVENMSGIPAERLKNVVLVDEGYAYADAVKIESPFPCNPHYDAKALKWLLANLDQFEPSEPIVFWDVGA